jgi:hypothetical protein
MKTTSADGNLSPKHTCISARAIIVAGFLFYAMSGSAQTPPGGTNAIYYTPLNTWSFTDDVNWTSDNGYLPVSFTNLGFSYLGDGASLVVDTNIPAWLRYNVKETDRTTNLTVDVGSVTFWFAPDWSSTNVGGLGPQEWGRLLEVGGYTPDSSYGWWSIYVDAGGNNLYFSAQTNDLSSNVTMYVSAPISWTTNYFHYVVLTYCATNTALYLDGGLAATGPPLTVYPGPNVLANGFFIGSDSNGIWQAHGLFNDLETYNVPMDAGTIQGIYDSGIEYYMMNPSNIKYMSSLASGPSSPSTNAVTPDVITGAGFLQSVTNTANNVNGSDAYHVWITNVTAKAVGNGNVNVTFTIEGGLGGYYYDVFATGDLQGALTNDDWFWMGQGQHFNTYTIPNIDSADAFLILGTPLDSDGDGLTDAYELLVSHTDPNNKYSNLDGIPDGWDVLLGLNPQTSNLTQPGERSNYGYTTADWLNAVSGVKSGTINLDNEGNVTQVSQ